MSDQGKKAEVAEVKLVPMERDDGKTADVHPDMVAEYEKGGFRVVAPEKKAAAKK